MKACVLHAVGDLRFEEVPTPVAKAGEVLVHIHACGICGSDLPRVLTKGTYHFPTIPGHEFAGEIIAVGEGVDAGLIGRTAAVFPLLPCFKCAACQTQDYALCADYNYFGSRCDGGFAEYLATPVWNIVLADGLTYEQAAMCEPAAVAAHAVSQGRVTKGESVAIFGAGPIGVLLAGWSQAAGAEKVMLIDIDQQRLDFAASLGYTNVFNSTTGDAAAWVKEQTKGGADLCIEGAGVSPTLEGAMWAAKTFGRVVCMGNPAKDMSLTQKGYWEILRKELTVTGTWNSHYGDTNNDWHRAIDAIRAGKIKTSEQITHRYPLEAGIEPFRMMSEHKEFFGKVMYTME